MEMLIDGAWVAARSGATFAAGSPATGEPIGEVPEGDREDARRAITAANRAADAWGRTTAFECAAAMHRVADAIEEKRLERPSRELRLTRKAGAPGASAARSHRRDHAFELAVHDARGTNRVGARLWQHGRVDTCIHDCGGRDRALERGAKVVAGGSRASGFPTRLYWEATILDDVRHSLVAQEEPSVPSRRWSRSTHSSTQSSLSTLRLTVSSPRSSPVISRAVSSSPTMCEPVWVNVNESWNYWESHLPFGGRSGSASGIGRVGGTAPMESFTELQTIVLS
jgi:acyl-CoA reductase-like NAD-dependent aldehyde dehydrogenase